MFKSQSADVEHFDFHALLAPGRTAEKKNRRDVFCSFVTSAERAFCAWVPFHSIIRSRVAQEFVMGKACFVRGSGAFHVAPLRRKPLRRRYCHSVFSESSAVCRSYLECGEVVGGQVLRMVAASGNSLRSRRRKARLFATLKLNAQARGRAAQENSDASLWSRNFETSLRRRLNC